MTKQSDTSDQTSAEPQDQQGSHPIQVLDGKVWHRIADGVEIMLDREHPTSVHVRAADGGPRE